MKWLISTEISTCFGNAGGINSRMEPYRSIYVIDDHPALYLARAKQKLWKLERGEGGEFNFRADDILAVFWTFPLDGTGALSSHDIKMIVETMS
jgi:hypothetical protein